MNDLDILILIGGFWAVIGFSFAINNALEKKNKPVILREGSEEIKPKAEAYTLPTNTAKACGLAFILLTAIPFNGYIISGLFEALDGYVSNSDRIDAIALGIALIIGNAAIWKLRAVGAHYLVGSIVMLFVAAHQVWKKI